MTLQVAMTGTGGIVLAGDLRWTVPLNMRGKYWKEGRNGGESTKFKIDLKRGIAVACAGDMVTAGHLADEILRLSNADLRNPIQPVQTIAEQLEKRDRKDAECLMVINGQLPRLFSFSTMETRIIKNEPKRVWSPNGLEQKAFAVAGCYTNAALFWVERYYDKRCPLQRLVPFAAHVIRCAAKLNPEWVSGLEIVVCESTGIYYLQDESIRQLEQGAEEFEQSVEELFRRYQETFPYTK